MHDQAIDEGHRPGSHDSRRRRDDDSWLRRAPRRRTGTLRVEGTIPDRFAVRVGVVGSRRTEDEDQRMAAALTRGLVAGGAWIVSGGAPGVDAIAHQVAVQAGGRTMVMLPAGLGQPHPTAHAGLYRRVVACGGGLASFVPDDEAVGRHRFLQRNDWLVAAVDALVVVAARRRSGSMHCARAAWQASVPVWTVPWGLDREGRGGCLELLRCGARAVWTEDQAYELARQIAEHPPTRWLVRDRQPPTIARQTATVPPADRGEHVDDPGEARQGCTPADGAEDHEARPAQADAAPEPKAVHVLRGARRPMTVEEVSTASSMVRDSVGATLLQAALRGAVRRRPDGRYEAT